MGKIASLTVIGASRGGNDVGPQGGKMKKAAFAALLAVAFMLTVDCAMSWPLFGPPGPYAEAIIGSPGPGYIWIGGYWGWSHGRYVWNRGHWARSRPGRAWVPGRWERHGNHYEYHRGFWR
jgi:hypothetical protein